jgi:hypothetical protein
MSQPGYLWPEPACYLSGSALTVKQARWQQRTSFLSLVEPAKWMVVVYVNDVIVYGQVPSLASGNTTAYTDEMPLSQESLTVDLGGHGVDATTPLYPTVKVEQFAATKVTTGWWWGGNDIALGATPLRIFIDSNGGVRKPAVYPPSQDWADGDSWLPLSRGFYDEGCKYPTDFTYTDKINAGAGGAPSGSVGMQFQTMLPSVRFDGVQIWTPPGFFPDGWETDPSWVPIEVMVRLWEGSAASAGTNVVREKRFELGPNWTNHLWRRADPYATVAGEYATYADLETGAGTYDTLDTIPDPYPAKTFFVEGTPSAGDPYPLISNPAHDGWYTIGYQTDAGEYRVGPIDADYLPLYPEHDKLFMDDNYPAIFNMINRFSPVEEKGPEWAPHFGTSDLLLIGPIVTYTPIYPVPTGMVMPQVYRRVGPAQ